MDGCTDAIAALHKHQNQCAALAAVLIARLESTAVLEGSILAVDSWQCDISLMSMRADLAGILSVSEAVAGQLILHAGTLVNYLPATMEGLSSGWLGWDYAVIIAEETSLLREAGLGQETVDAFEQVLLGKAAGATLPSFREKARRRRERFYPETITPKTRREYSQRRLGVSRARDGMSWLSLYAPAPTVEAIWAQCTLTAQAAQGPHEERTLTQLRADVAAALLLNQSMAENQIYAPTQPNTTTNSTGTADGTSNAATTATGGAPATTATDGAPAGAGAGTGSAAANGAEGAAGTATGVVVPGDAQGPWFEPIDPAADGVPLDPGPEPWPDPTPEPVPIRDRDPDWDYVARQDRDVVVVPDRWVPVFDDPDYSDPGFKDPDIRNSPDGDPTAIPPTLTPAPSSANNATTSTSTSANLASIAGGEGTTASNTTTGDGTGTGAGTGFSATGGGACLVGPVWPPMPQVAPVLLIPALSLLGATNEPAWLEGYGPLSMEVARHLAAGSPSLLRVLVDPISNEPLDVAPQRYRISQEMRTMLQIRDEYCQFPGCLAKATNCEIDHLKKFEHGGLSIYDNLETLCHRHHVLKHFKDDRTRTGECRTDQSPEREAVRLRGWTPAMVDGRVAWTSPTGRYYPPEIGDTQPPVYPEWLKTHINETLGQPDTHETTNQNTTDPASADPQTADPESAAEFHDPQDPQDFQDPQDPQEPQDFQDFEDFLDFAFLDEADIPGPDQDDNPYARPLPVPPPGTFPTDEEQAALDKETLANYLVSHPDLS
ncbi:DUF222 domain-containing protein [Specibacter sp. AOP5-B1-6]|uniref:DUF222 domain-containing protein n=1 Tax=Specibacter sp. AOP5-B1-6 TaxID=3457653 RepID=UPI00402BDF4A